MTRITPGLAAALLTAMLAVPRVAAAPQVPDDRVALVDWTAPVATGWVRQAPRSSMRLAQFRAPGAGDAEVVVYYFGLGGGGSIPDNIERWVSQFTGPDGGGVKPAITHGNVGGMPFTTVELLGTYARGVGMGPQGTPLADHVLRVHVVETPVGNLTFQLWGPRAAVERHRHAFDAMAQGLTPVR